MNEPVYLILVSTASGYVAHRLIATKGEVFIYAPVGAGWGTIESAERFMDSVAEQEL